MRVHGFCAVGRGGLFLDPLRVGPIYVGEASEIRSSAAKFVGNWEFFLNCVGGVQACGAEGWAAGSESVSYM